MTTLTLCEKDIMATYSFGVLDTLFEPIDFEIGIIEPLIESDTITDLLHEQGFYEAMNRQWWIYPPISVQQTHDSSNNTWVTRGYSRRPALLWHLPGSHRLTISREDENREFADILIQTLALFDGTRLQFDDWFHTGRRVVRRERRCHMAFGAVGYQIPQILWQVGQRYLTLTEDQRRCLRCILHQYNRVQIYEWHWEQFACAYSVVDACWALFTTQNRCGWEGTGQVRVMGSPSHRERMRVMCEELGIDTSREEDLAAFDEFTRVRNQLTHEAVWASGIPGYANSSEHVHLTYALDHFVGRLVLHALGIECSYRITPGWSAQSTPAFGLVSQDGPPAHLTMAHFE